MPEERERNATEAKDGLTEVIARKEARKQKAREEGKRGLARGLGTFGMVGWSVAIPTIGGIALGVWIDGRSGTPYSWTLMLMFLGLILGLANAWYWISRESDRE